MFAAVYGTKWPKAAAKITDDLDVLLAFYEPPASRWQTETGLAGTHHVPGPEYMDARGADRRRSDDTAGPSLTAVRAWSAIAHIGTICSSVRVRALDPAASKTDQPVASASFPASGAFAPYFPGCREVFSD